MAESASPAFQPDRPGSPGFQLAEDAGFQTQTPVRVGDWTVVVTVDATVFAGPAPPAVDRTGDWLVEVLADAVVTFQPWQPLPPTAVWLPGRRRRQVVHIEADALVIVDADAVVRFVPAPLQRVDILAPVVLGRLYADATVTALDYVHEVLIPAEDEELLLALGAEGRAAHALDDELVLLIGGR